VLRGIASSAIDVSDGLAGDLGHILKASGTGAVIDTEIASNLIAACAHHAWPEGQFDSETRLRLALTGGDDYELAFTAPPARHQAVLAAARAAQTPVTRIGRIEASPGLWLAGADGQRSPLAARAFDHFG